MGVVLPLAPRGLHLAVRTVLVRQVGEEVAGGSHRAEQVQSKDGGLLVHEAAEVGILQEVEAGRMNKVEEGGSDGTQIARVAEGDVGVDEANRIAQLGQPVDRGFVLQLDRAKLAVKFGGQSVERDLGERGEGKVVGDRVDFVACDEVGLGVGGLERGDVTVCPDSQPSIIIYRFFLPEAT